MKYQTLILLLSLALVAVSCGPTARVVRIETLNPAKVPVGYGDKTFAIFNALHATGEEGETVTYDTDSTLVNLLAEGAKEALEESDLFSDYDVPVFNLSLFCTDTCPELEDTDYMTSLAEQAQAGLLLIIDKASSFLRQQEYGGAPAFYVYYEALYRFYDAGTQRYVNTVADKDSLLLTLNNSTRRNMTEEDLHEIWREVVRDAGRKFLESTVPQWQADYRFYFMPSGFYETAWDNAAYYAERGNWPEAMKIWGDLAGSTTGKLAAYAAFNMALGAEMLNEFSLSLEWLALADKNVRLEETNGYRTRIQKRMMDIKNIAAQIDN